MLKIFGYTFLIIFLFGIIGFTMNTCSRVGKTATDATHIDDAVQNYEEFQTLYNTCEKINTDLCMMKNLPEKDVMFEQFSKTQRISTLQIQLNRWVEEYNAKSKMWGRQLWKSNKLPRQLSVNQFNCY